MLTYNSLAMYRQQQQSGQQTLSQQVQQHQAQHGQHSPEDTQYWYGYPHGHAHTAHHQSSGGPQQYLNPTDVLTWPHAHAHHYSHLQYQHHQAYQQQQQQQQQQMSAVGDWSSDEGNNSSAVGVVSEPSPPTTISGSEVSSPGTPATPPANNNNNANAPNNNTDSATSIRQSQIRSPFEWMKKPSYQTQPNPGKTRTKDKYRVVYTDHQRLELEKEFHFSRYITIRRKAELAANLALSERQVKIWFQNRRAKERKQSKKREEQESKDIKPTTEELAGSMASLGFAGMSSVLGSLMQNGGSPPLTPHPLALGHSPASLHAHHSHHSHPVLGL